MTQVAYMMGSSGSMTLLVGNKNYSVNSSHPNYGAILTALKNKTHDKLEKLLDISGSITAAFSGRGVTVQNGQVLFNGTPLHNTITTRILQFMNEGLPHMPLVKFLENLMENPSSTSVAELYDFLEHEGFPITEDGCFIGYKGIRADWKDKYSGKIDNSIGQKPLFKRNEVDDNRANQCSWGLHVGTLEYARNYSSDRVVLVKVNPKDAVSVPLDHDASKLRVCTYEVIAEAPQERINTPMYPMPQASGNGWNDGEDEDDQWDEYDDHDEDDNGHGDDDEGCAVQSPHAFLRGETKSGSPKRMPCLSCGAKGGKRHAPKCNRSRKS